MTLAKSGALLFLFVLFQFSCKPKVAQPLEPKSQKSKGTVSRANPTIQTDSSDFDSYFIPTKDISSPYGPQNITRTILHDRNGTIWLATWEGIQSYDGKSFTNHTNKEGLRSWRAFSILEDRKGNIWFAMVGAGVYKYDGKVFTNLSTKDGLVNDRVTNIYEDKAGNIWFGTEGGASKYDGSSFVNFTREDGLLDQDINAIFEDESGKFWFGARGTGSYYDGEKFTSMGLSNVRSIIKDRNNNIWLGGNDGLLRYDGREFVKYGDEFVGRVYEDQEGNIWTNSESAENKNEWVLRRHLLERGEKNTLVSTEVYREKNMFCGITQDSGGNIWFGALNGVCRYDGTTFDWFRDQH